MTNDMTTNDPSETASETAPAEIQGIPAPPPAPGKGTAVGRRKTATARVTVRPGNGKISVNGRALDDYFTDIEQRMETVRALEKMGARNRYDVVAKVEGGGPTGQAGALSLGIARALAIAEPSLRAALRAEIFLTRDARRKERKKYGRRGARRGFQFSKR